MSNYSLSGEVVGAKELKEAFKNAPSLVDQFFKPALNQSAIEIKVGAKNYAPVHTGQLRASINHKEAYRSGDNIVAEVGTDVIHAKSQEYGYKRWIPIAPLKRWAYLKLGNPNLAGAIQRKIAFKGVEGKFFFKKGREDAIGRFESLIRGALTSLTKALATK